VVHQASPAPDKVRVRNSLTDGAARRIQGGATGTHIIVSSKRGSMTAREAKAKAAARGGGGVRSNGAHNAAAGAVAGVMVSLCLHPVDTLKVCPPSYRTRRAVSHGERTTVTACVERVGTHDTHELDASTLPIHYPASHTGAHPVQRHLLRSSHPACAVRLRRVARHQRALRGPGRQSGRLRAH
jgi:hypothetical protein